MENWKSNFMRWNFQIPIPFECCTISSSCTWNELEGRQAGQVSPHRFAGLFCFILPVAAAAVLPPSLPPSFLVHIILFVLAGWLVGVFDGSMAGWQAGRMQYTYIPVWPVPNRTQPGGRPRCMPINNACVKLIKLLNIYVQTIRDYVLWFHWTSESGRGTSTSSSAPLLSLHPHRGWVGV